MFENVQESVICKHAKASHTSLLRECIRTNSVTQGRLLHAYFVEAAAHGHNIPLWTTLIDMYSKCGAIRDARAVFESMSHRNVVCWTAMIAGYARCIDVADEALVLFHQLLSEVGVIPNEYTFLSVLNACSHLGHLEVGRMVHAFLVDSGIQLDGFVGNALINMYIKCDGVEDAHNVFRSVPSTEVVTWTVLITGYAKQGLVHEAFQLFQQMECEGLHPDEVAFGGVLTACTFSTSLSEGRRLHAILINLGLCSSLVLESSLIDMYSKCDSIDDASRVFSRTGKQNVVSWNAMVMGYVRHGMIEEAFKLCHKMLAYSNHVTFVTILKLCATIRDLERGTCIHVDIIWHGFDLHLSVGNALIDFYISCERLEDARRVFDRLPHRDIVSWTQMIAVCIKNEFVEEANDLFSRMESDRVQANRITFLTMITACSAIGHLEQGMRIHSKIMKLGMETGSFVANAFIDMYSKCGDIHAAYLLFEKLPCQDVVSWNAIVSGYALHGSVTECLLHAIKMQQTETKPNDITFLGVLSACSRAGMIEEGFSVFHFMVKNQQILPIADHLVCMVDLLARAGHVEAAEAIIRSLPLDITTVVWRALLNACRLHACVKLAACVIEHLLSSKRQDASAFALVCNVVAAADDYDAQP